MVRQGCSQWWSICHQGELVTWAAHMIRHTCTRNRMHHPWQGIHELTGHVWPAGITSTSSLWMASGATTRCSHSCQTPWGTSTTGCLYGGRTPHRRLWRSSSSSNNSNSSSNSRGKRPRMMQVQPLCALQIHGLFSSGCEFNAGWLGSISCRTQRSRSSRSSSRSLSSRPCCRSMGTWLQSSSSSHNSNPSTTMCSRLRRST